MGSLPEAVRQAYEAEIARLELILKHVEDEKEASRIRDAIVELQVELMDDFFELEE